MSFYYYIVQYIYKNVENFLCICNSINIINTIKNKFLVSPNYIKISLYNYFSILFKFKTLSPDYFSFFFSSLLQIKSYLFL